MAMESTKSLENPPRPKALPLVTAARRAPRWGKGGFLEDFFDFYTPRWTIRADYRLSFLIDHPDKCIRVHTIIREWWAPRQAPLGRKTRQNHPKPSNRPLGVPHANLFLDGLGYGR